MDMGYTEDITAVSSEAWAKLRAELMILAWQNSDARLEM